MARSDFPIFDRGDLAFLDSAASSQKPNSVLEAMDEMYRVSYANVHRGAYELSAVSTDAYEQARQNVAAFIGAPAEEVVFTRGATTSLNMLAFRWGRDRLKPGDKIVLSIAEHHANLVPWQMAAQRTGAELVFAPLDLDYQIDVEALRGLIDDAVKIVSITGMSNVLGSMPPIPVIAEMTHAVGATLIVDGAQLVPHAPVDVKTLGADALVFSGHKMLGPTGIGVLWATSELLNAMEPFEGGGDMIETVSLHSSTWAPIPQKHEAGTPPFVQAVGLSAAVDYLRAYGMDNVRAHDMEITAYALEKLGQRPDITVYGPKNVERRGGAVAFTMDGVHPHDLATILDEHGVAIRAGNHCARPLMDHLGVPATARMSFYLYNTTSDVDQLLDGLDAAGAIFGIE